MGDDRARPLLDLDLLVQPAGPLRLLLVEACFFAANAVIRAGRALAARIVTPLLMRPTVATGRLEPGGTRIPWWGGDFSR